MGFKKVMFNRKLKKHKRKGWFCSFKGKDCIHYQTKEKAEHALSFTNEYENQNYVPVRAYHCNCGYWHLTSKV